MSRIQGSWSLCAAVMLGVALNAGACSSGSGTSGSGGRDASADATTLTCTTNAQCAAEVPATTPAGCATGTCNTVEGVCTFSAKDEDDDGHPAALCTSNVPGVTVLAGDDCNDHDPHLYPGHPEACPTPADAGASFCAGEVKCEPDGTESACTATLTCGADQSCVAGACVTGCNIGGMGYTAQAPNPANACQKCDPTSSTTAWTTTSDGSACGTGLVCAKGTCASQCVIGGSVYPAGTSNPTNACQTCVPGTGTDTWSDSPPGTVCGVAQYCNGGNCTSGCQIAGVGFVVAGTANPNDACEFCSPSASTTMWTSDPNGGGCGNGQVCSSGQCGTQCDIGGAIVPTGSVNPANPCQSCQPGTSVESWSTLASGTGCGAGQVCQGPSCTAGCSIGGVGGTFYAPQTLNPSNACLSCQPASSTTGWTPLAPGASCGPGDVCDGSSCVSGCSIGGTVYTASTLNPANACQSCEPATSTTAWTTLSDGTSCETSDFCSSGSCEPGCFIGGTFHAPGALGPGGCQSCQPSTSTTAWTPLTPGTSCGTGQLCDGTTCASQCFIGGAFYAAEALNPTNACQFCVAGATAWTDGDGTACGAGSSTQFCFGGSCQAPPSCATAGPGTTNCGSTSESCCTSLPVMGGTYARTYTNTGSGPTSPSDPATVSNFRLDKYEVTVGRFRQFVNAWNDGAGFLPPAGSGKHTHLNGGLGLANSGSAGTYEAGWDAADWNNPTDLDPTSANLECNPSYSAWTATAGANENKPINCVNWFEAYAFCIWDGGFLPSEAEWEYAAAGGSQEREFPWGSTFPGTACPGTGCSYAIYDCRYPSGGPDCSSLSNLASVGTATSGAGVWGQLDLAGNVFEWNLDWFAPYVDPCTDCADLSPASARVLRGGDFYEDSPLEPTSRAYNLDPTNRYLITGLRCARTP